jgi:hypothetical protein
VAARALLACAFAARFDMAGLGEGCVTQGRGRGEVGGIVFEAMKQVKASCSYVSKYTKETHARTSVTMAEACGLREICGSA